LNIGRGCEPAFAVARGESSAGAGAAKAVRSKPRLVAKRHIGNVTRPLRREVDISPL
jgi:hypothetical protein